MDYIREDLQRITTDTNEFAVPVLFSVTDGVTITSVTCNAIATKHNIVVDETTGLVSTGLMTNGRNVRIAVSELALKALSYPVRTVNNFVSLIGHTVTWKDVSNVQITYVIREQYPDETTGLIVLQLGNYGVLTPPGRLIIGWMPAMIEVLIVASPNPANTQTLANGDIIPKEYALNLDGTLTIPYLVNRNVLTPFVFDNVVTQDVTYNKTTGTFDGSVIGGFQTNNYITINASVPIWQPS